MSWYSVGKIFSWCHGIVQHEDSNQGILHTTIYAYVFLPELRGRMHLVGGNLIAILRSAKYGKTQNQFPKNGGGVIALFGKNGNEVYWLSMKALPRYIDCSTLDISENNGNACLIVGDSGYMAALNPVTGELAL